LSELIQPVHFARSSDAVLRWRVTSAWVVIGGALLGWPLSLLA